MRKITLLCAVTMMLGLSGCDMERAKQIEAKIRTQGYADVAKLPDGRTIYMTEVETGGGSIDRVYFIGNVTTAIENCGKGCTRSIVTTKID